MPTNIFLGLTCSSYSPVILGWTHACMGGGYEHTRVVPQNYRWQNGKLRCIYRHHLKVALPRCNKECFSRRNCAADGRLCRSRVAAKIFVFLISRNFREIFNFVFRQIILKFHEILQNNFIKISCFAKILILCFATFY